MNIKELAERLAEYYVVNKKELLELNFFNPNDKRLIQFNNGAWGLRKWVDKWKKEIDNINEILKEYFDKKEQAKRKWSRAQTMTRLGKRNSVFLLPSDKASDAAIGAALTKALSQDRESTEALS